VGMATRGEESGRWASVQACVFFAARVADVRVSRTSLKSRTLPVRCTTTCSWQCPSLW
jgi:hypothetical protein